MDILISDFQPYKDKIPQFVMKLYHILEQRQYNEYLSWHGDNQIVIKHPKRFQDKVLAHFFRHRHLSSFIRQLNMYKFNKVTKLMKEKNHMYFKNDNFKRGFMQSDLVNIKRNTKKSKRQSLSLQTISDPNKDESISIDQQLNNQTPLAEYRHFVQDRTKQMLDMLKNISSNHPILKQQIAQCIMRCNQILQNQSQRSNNSFINMEQSRNHSDNNMFGTMKYLEPILFPSQCNF